MKKYIFMIDKDLLGCSTGCGRVIKTEVGDDVIEFIKQKNKKSKRYLYFRDCTQYEHYYLNKTGLNLKKEGTK